MTTIGNILVVEDNQFIRESLVFLLELQGHRVVEVDDGEQALVELDTRPFDLVLMDVMMPRMNGYEALEIIKSKAHLKHIPVVMLSAVEEINTVAKCINLGAEDYLFKPFNKTLLQARIHASLEKKKWIDLERGLTEQLKLARKKSEDLLLNILPKPISERLKAGEHTIVDTFDDVTVLFADIVGFTNLFSHHAPIDLIEMLNDLFTRFDILVGHHQAEKIKTIGDAYMAVCGLPTPSDNHAEIMANLALDMLGEVLNWNAHNPPIQIRIGLSSGPAIAGVLGMKRFVYDVWGDVVNMSDRMQSSGEPNKIQVSNTTYQRLEGLYDFESRGKIHIKGKGDISTYWLHAKKEISVPDLVF